MLPLSQSIYLHRFPSIPSCCIPSGNISAHLAKQYIRSETWVSGKLRLRGKKKKKKYLLSRRINPHIQLTARPKGEISQVCGKIVLRERLPARRPSAPQQECRGRRAGRGLSEQHAARLQADACLRQGWAHSEGAALKERDFSSTSTGSCRTGKKRGTTGFFFYNFFPLIFLSSCSKPRKVKFVLF